MVSGAEEMTQELRAKTALAENPSSVSNTQVGQLQAICNSSSGIC